MNTEIICIVDRSGSMQTIRDDAIGGFNAFLAGQKAVPDTARVSVILFDHEYTPLYGPVELAEAQGLTGETFQPRGNTALLDAIGRTLATQGARVASELWADKVIVCILTDGYENASREYTRPQIRKLIRDLEAAGKWQFVYLGANQDAFAEAADLGIEVKTHSGIIKVHAWDTSSARSTRFGYGVTGQSVGAMRGEKPKGSK